MTNRLDSSLTPIVVISALQGVSNRLSKIADAAAVGSVAVDIEQLQLQHEELAESLELDGRDLLKEYFRELDTLVEDIRHANEATPRLQAAVLSLGELMSTTLGAAFLRAQGLNVLWQDARQLLKSDDRMRRSPTQRYLSATCNHDPDPVLQKQFEKLDGFVLTQGFIAVDEAGDAVLLGREGSDTSAAYFASKLQARRVEIWKDVPGMFSADPRLVPSARLLVDLHYDEARELASTGSTVLHPRSLSPLSRYGIPLFIRCIGAPEVPGTIVSAAPRELTPQVKGISARKDVTLISMDGMAMWHEVGFLADAFAAFARHGVSIDLVSTSESNVTVSVDNIDGMFPDHVRDALLVDLQKLCRVRTISGCATISLVGRR
ncbi:MAG: aspartate kinase, partial [Woeseiaceae bacterium]